MHALAGAAAKDPPVRSCDLASRLVDPAWTDADMSPERHSSCMNTLAKRLYNVAPDDIKLTFSDDSTVSLAMRQAEFFQDELEAEGQHADGTTYRIVDGDDDDDALLVARETDDGWQVVGEAVDVERA
jgi:hypothetical protein